MQLGFCDRGTGHISVFSIIIDYGMKMPSGFTETVPEFYLLLLLQLKKGWRRCAMAMDLP